MMTILNKVKLITFDVTNTLLKFRSSPGAQYGEIGAMYGVLYDNNVLSTNFKKSWKRMIKEHPNFGLKSGISWEEWWKRVVQGTFTESKFKIKDDKVDAISNHLLDLYKTSAAWQHCDGAPELLSFIQGKGILMGVISNFDPRLDQILTNTKLRQYFDFVLTSYDSAAEKPDPAIFNKAMDISKIHKLQSENCLHIGDNLHLDYLGAKNSGWQSILVQDLDEKTLKKDHPEVEIDSRYLFGSLFQLHSYFKDSRNCSVVGGGQRT